MDFGRMAVLADPQGAVFAIWEAKRHWGVTIRDEANTLCWNELATHDPAAAAAFYKALTGWTAKSSPEYTEWRLGETPIGGMRTINEGEPTPPSWMPYFMVDDCDATTAKAQSLGGVACVEPRDLPGVGRFAVLIDPQGAVFALYRHR
jgi:predicted enzyme related to lactoylglutathione lyase